VAYILSYHKLPTFIDAEQSQWKSKSRLTENQILTSPGARFDESSKEFSDTEGRERSKEKKNNITSDI
jgi:hypothetical protein